MKLITKINLLITANLCGAPFDKIEFEIDRCID